MPAPNPNNPYHCDRPMRCNGKTKAGSQKYRCSCGFNCTDSDRPAHRPLLKSIPLTQVEKNKRYRDKNRDKWREAKRVARRKAKEQ